MIKCIVTLGWLLAALPAMADSPVVLDGELKAALESLAPIDGNGANALDGKVVVVTFFASWCPPCHVEFLHLNKVRAAYSPDEVAIVAINMFEDQGRFADQGERLEDFVYRYMPEFAVVHGTEAVRLAFDDVRRIPTLFVFGRDGAPVLRFIHERDAEQTNPEPEAVDAAIRAAL